MTLVRYTPAISRLNDEISRVFTALSATDGANGAASAWVPPVDILEHTDRFELAVDLPGVDPEKVDITLEDGVLSISGEREPEVRRAEDGTEARMRTERGHGRFYRRFVLPETVDAERVQASGRNGVLAITIPKQAKAQPRRIKVS